MSRCLGVFPSPMDESPASLSEFLLDFREATGPKHTNRVRHIHYQAGMSSWRLLPTHKTISYVPKSLRVPRPRNTEGGTRHR